MDLGFLVYFIISDFALKVSGGTQITSKTLSKGFKDYQSQVNPNFSGL